jgi:hypothetical protein
MAIYFLEVPMLTEKTPDTIKASLTVKAQGVENTLMLTYFNHAPEKYDEFIKNPENLKVPDGIDNDMLGIAHINASLALFLVKSFDDGTDKAFPLNRDGLVKLERTWPGTLTGIVRGYHQARGAAVEKN